MLSYGLKLSQWFQMGGGGDVLFPYLIFTDNDI